MQDVPPGLTASRLPVTALASMLALGACGDGTVTLAGSNRDSRVLALMADVRQPDPEGLFLRWVDYGSSDERLHAAAFLHLRGKTRGEALAALTADGFDCTGTTCTTTVAERETWVAVNFGIRLPGAPRTFVRVHAVEVTGDRVVQMSDLAASVTLAVGDGDD